MKLIVGLGNPGAKYRFTRHNAGFMVVDRLAGAAGTTVNRRRCFSLVGEGRLNGVRVVLAKPQTYMNLSGLAVSDLFRHYRVGPADLLVICDDLDLEFGRIRLRPKGGSGGHRGLASIIAALGSSEFPRLRVGIGKAEEASAHVLGEFAPEDQSGLEEILSTAALAAACACREGLDEAMNRFNGWRLTPASGTAEV
ncbi:MAG: aminoacyl-tRNA hydrolase [Bacillota bacterium]